MPNMILSMFFLAGIAFSSVVSAAVVNSTREFKLVSKVKTGQLPAAQAFDGLYLTSYHSAAGLSDAVMLDSSNSSVVGFFNATDPVITGTNGQAYQNLIFDLGSAFQWTPQIQSANAYVQWVAVAIQAGGNKTQFGSWFVNETGLQIDSAPGKVPSTQNVFGGWMLCQWWRGVPQLFMRLTQGTAATPANCANINLQLEFI